MNDDAPPEARRYPCPAWMAARFPEDGRIDFRRFVELALHEPGHGYYGRGIEVIGPDGDYVTGSTADPAFARAILRHAQQLDARLGHPDPFDLVDAGSGSGRFLAALAAQAPGVAPRLAPRLRLSAVEASDGLRARLSARLAGVPHRAVAAPDELPDAMAGLLFSYELYDALPFARLMGREDGSLAAEQVILDRQDGTIRIGLGEPEPDVLATAASDGIVRLEPGQEIEVVPAAAPLATALARRFERGTILTFDYGARARALYNPVGRPHGTATAHRGHRAHRGLLENPGEQDLTAHVNFSQLERAGEAAGFATVGLVSQARFLLEEGGLARELTETTDPIARGAILRLVELDGMGEDLRVLIQSR